MYLCTTNNVDMQNEKLSILPLKSLMDDLEKNPLVVEVRPIKGKIDHPTFFFKICGTSASEPCVKVRIPEVPYYTGIFM